jgi:hypothetical protein
MPRYIRNTAILAKIEVTEGVDSVPTGALNALLVSDVSINPLNAQNVDRDLIRPFFGGSEQLVGTAYKEVTFTVELAGSGTASVPPAWGALVVACGFIESGAAGFRQFAPDTPANQKSCTIYYFDDGVRHVLLGAKGTFRLVAGVGERPTLAFTFLGKDGGETAVANPALTLTAWRAPQVITDTNSGDVRTGGAYATGAVTGGTAFTSRGLELDLGNTVTFTPLLGGDFIDVTARTVTGTLQLDLTAAQEVTFMGTVKANTTTTLSLEHGTVAGNIVGVHLAAAQLINPSKQELNGRRMIGFDVRSVPVAGNDDLIIYTK